MSVETEQQKQRTNYDYAWDAFNSDPEILAAQAEFNKVLDSEHEKYENNPSVQQVKAKKQLIFRVHDEQVDALKPARRAALENKDKDAFEKSHQEQQTIFKDRAAIWHAYCETHPDLVAEEYKAWQLYQGVTSNARSQYDAVVERKKREKGIPTRTQRTDEQTADRFSPEWDC